ncbi:DNA-binding NarL/FixJ family response regulator [Microbacteriaceae bacterium MWH-Ta3]|nr:DNA-binding NarL/FixJ family response regulator [Microbacteriaceae bacterium MWH-Ta3]
MALIPRRNLLIVEDEPMVAALLGEALTVGGFDVHIAGNALEGIRQAQRCDPDVAVLDINLGHGGSGIELAHVLDRQFPGIAIIFLTKHPDIRTAGYSPSDLPQHAGYIRKDFISDSASVIRAIEDAISQRQPVRAAATPSWLDALTSTQLQVLRLVAQGYTNGEIARRRNTSARAVELLLKSIYATMQIDVSANLNPRVEAVRRFITEAGTPERQ